MASARIRPARTIGGRIALFLFLSYHLSRPLFLHFSFKLSNRASSASKADSEAGACSDCSDLLPRTPVCRANLIPSVEVCTFIFR